MNATIGFDFDRLLERRQISQLAALLFLAVITTAISVFGYFIVHRYERYAWIPMFLLFGYVLVNRRAALQSQRSGQRDRTGASSRGVALFGGAIFGYAIGWSSYAADYTRRQPANTLPRAGLLVCAGGRG